MSSSRPTLRNVAQNAGVSIATASIVLRRVPNKLIGEDTRKRVLTAARRLHYRHNALAASLRTGKTDMVAVVVDRLSSPALAAKLAAAENVLCARGMRPVFWHTSHNAEMEEQAINEIRSQMVSGLIVGYEPSERGVELLVRLVEEAVPMVLLEQTPGVAAHVVTVDRDAVTYIATRRLLSLGHRRIGLTGSDKFLDLVNRHGRGYVRALAETGLEPQADLIYHLSCEGTFRAGYEVGKRVLDSDSPPTGLVCSDDEVAVGVMRACRERGVVVPHGLAIVGFDDLPVAEFVDVPLTTVGHPTQQVGELAAELLLEDIAAGELSQPQEVILQPKLIVRDSCGARRPA